MWMKQQWIQRRKAHPKKIITKCKLNARAAFDLFFSCSFLSCNVKDGQMQTMAKFIIILDIAVVHFRQTYFAEFSCWGYRISRIQNWNANFWFTFRIFSMIKCVFCIIYLLKEKFYFPSHLNFSFAGVSIYWKYQLFKRSKSSSGFLSDKSVLSSTWNSIIPEFLFEVASMQCSAGFSFELQSPHASYDRYSSFIVIMVSDSPPLFDPGGSQCVWYFNDFWAILERFK